MELAGIDNNDSVLFIGGGSIPCTALQMASMTGARVMIIDVDPVAVEGANKIISKLNLSHRVKARLISGQKINAGDFSVIHIARQAMPHDEIMENITNKLSDDTRILLRSNLFCFEKLRKIHVDNCKYIYIQQIKQGFLGLKSTFMFTIKKDRRSESESKRLILILIALILILPVLWSADYKLMFDNITKISLRALSVICFLQLFTILLINFTVDTLS